MSLWRRSSLSVRIKDCDLLSLFSHAPASTSTPVLAAGQPVRDIHITSSSSSCMLCSSLWGQIEFNSGLVLYSPVPSLFNVHPVLHLSPLSLSLSCSSHFIALLLQIFYWIFAQPLSRAKVRSFPIPSRLPSIISVAGLPWTYWPPSPSIIYMPPICTTARWVIVFELF